MDLQKIDNIAAFTKWLRVYHKHEVHGMENLPKKGPCIIAVNHSLATYDILLLCHAIYTEMGRIPRPLMDRWFFKLNNIGQLMQEMGAVKGEPSMASRLLENDEIICVAPGGMRESLRPSTERYQIIWERRKGFARLAIENSVPICLAACPKADDIFEIYPNQLSAWFYKKFKLPFAILRGLGPTPIPRPVKLIHFISEPIVPPKASKNPGTRKRQIDTFHKKLVKRMKQLIGEAITYR